MKDFLFANSEAHSLIASTLLKSGKPVASYPIGDMTDEKDWLLNHQNVHAEELSILGLDNIGVDLSQVDFKDKDQYHDWMTQHAYIHQFVNSALGLV